MADRKRGDRPTIVIRKEEVVEGGHHGGAWKVAYADFVTAMMAFFLLMWLLNATTEEQRRGLADYFSPNNVMARTTSGFGQPFGGTTPNIDGSLASTKGAVQMVLGPPHPVIDSDEDEGDIPAQSRPQRDQGAALVPTARDGGTAAALRAPPGDADPDAEPVRAGHPDAAGRRDSAAADPASPALPSAAVPPGAAQASGPSAASRADAERQEQAALERAAQAIQDAVNRDPALAAIAGQLKLDLLPEGLRIQVLDTDGQPMFASGSAALTDRARALLAKVAPVLLRLPEGLTIAGHTDAQPFRTGERSNWDLSADRAHATRRLLGDAGVPDGRIRAVAGNADRDLLLPGDPLAAANRRVAITVLRDLPLRPGAPRPASPPAVQAAPLPTLPPRPAASPSATGTPPSPSPVSPPPARAPQPVRQALGAPPSTTLPAVAQARPAAQAPSPPAAPSRPGLAPRAQAGRQGAAGT